MYKEDPSIWDAMAKPCSHYPRRSEYAEKFLKFSGIEPGDSVFDMGCGSGTLCLPLADDGHKVFCGDFSEKMLKSVQDVIEEENISLITLQKMSFLEDWDKLDIPVCDLAFASRCLFDLDPSVVLPKLTSKARKRVCITICVSFRDTSISSFKLGGHDSVEYFKSCIAAILDMGSIPTVRKITGRCEKDSSWVFISWETGAIM